MLMLWLACADGGGLAARFDHDGDGFDESRDFDCDDTNPAVFPGAIEHCDGVDEDCDGIVDESAADAGAWYIDEDGDGYGDPATEGASCFENGPGQGWVDNGEDCDDTDPDASPDEVEVPYNGVDDDCDPDTPDSTCSAVPPVIVEFRFEDLGIVEFDQGKRYAFKLVVLAEDEDHDLSPATVRIWWDSLNGDPDDEHVVDVRTPCEAADLDLGLTYAVEGEFELNSVRNFHVVVVDGAGMASSSVQVSGILPGPE